MFKKKLPQWSMLPAEVEVTHFYGNDFENRTVKIGQNTQKWLTKCFFLNKIYAKTTPGLLAANLRKGAHYCCRKANFSALLQKIRPLKK